MTVFKNYTARTRFRNPMLNVIQQNILYRYLDTIVLCNLDVCNNKNILAKIPHVSCRLKQLTSNTENLFQLAHTTREYATSSSGKFIDRLPQKHDDSSRLIEYDPYRL